MPSPLPLSLALAAGLAVPALAQSPAGPPSGSVPPGWVPPGANPQTGARPGNDIGTGMSLPTSDKAGHITGQDTDSPIAARLPAPPVGDNAAVRDFLVAAGNALAAGRTGEAQEALERAETRLLDRSIPRARTGQPVESPMVERIRRVLQMLATGNRGETMRLLEQTIAMQERQ